MTCCFHAKLMIVCLAEGKIDALSWRHSFSLQNTLLLPLTLILQCLSQPHLIPNVINLTLLPLLYLWLYCFLLLISVLFWTRLPFISLNLLCYLIPTSLSFRFFLPFLVCDPTVMWHRQFMHWDGTWRVLKWLHSSVLLYAEEDEGESSASLTEL